MKETYPMRVLQPAFFGCLLLVESVCFYLKSVDVNNLKIYNVWFPVEFVFYTYWVLCNVESVKVRTAYMFLIPVYSLGVAGIYLYSDSLSRFNTIAFQLGFLLLLPVILVKFYELLNGIMIENPVRNPLFWLLLGLLVSYSFSLCEFSLENYLHIHDESLLKALQVLNILLTDTLYVCIIVYFLLKWKEKRLNT